MVMHLQSIVFQTFLHFLENRCGEALSSLYKFFNANLFRFSSPTFWRLAEFFVVVRLFVSCCSICSTSG